MTLGLVSVLFLIVIISLCNLLVMKTANHLAYDNLEDVPVNEVALVLGTVKQLSNGRANLYFDYRIDAAYELYKKGKVKHFILSGDNSKRAYNEPEDMKIALIEKGVPESAITLDFAGFRTLDSVVRSKSIFQQKKMTIVSQKFHNYRALFIAQHKGINAIAYNAESVKASAHYKVAIREILARTKAVLDIFVLRKNPKFLGEKIDIKI